MARRLTHGVVLVLECAIGAYLGYHFYFWLVEHVL